MTTQASSARPRLLLGSLAALAGLAVVQQQILLRRPPWLQSVAIQPLRSGAAALDVIFSRPMDRDTVAASSLAPDLPHSWFGRQDRLRLLVDSGQPIRGPLRLELLGQDLRQLPLKKQMVWWNPRPHLLAVVPSGEGERLKLRLRDGRWQSLAPVQQRILQIEPLGNGSGVALVSDDSEARQRVLLRQLDQQALSIHEQGLGDPVLGSLEELESGDSGSLLFAHLSSNQLGELLVQLGGFEPDSDRVWIQSRGKARRLLDLKASGPLRLLPDGNGLVLPSYDGLELLPFNPSLDGGSRQSLPGSREVKAFCSGSGRALLVRHWPDYRRSLELVIPARPPKQVWLGEAGVMAAACDNGGERLWLVLREAGLRTEDVLLQLDSEGQEISRRSLGPWRLSSGSELDYDPVSDQLLTVVQKPAADNGRIALISGSTLNLEVLEQPAVLARWLPAGGVLTDFSKPSR
ncbi:putative conserved secreted protein [Synechococcus sp. MIT S9220]|uniref:hypothetical protein n=1 Tax=unclassified Synechococcus TaxID=2626047 RepID=UPI00164B20BF|nr:hypothetical protein [Synechococcus sp. MIT S9220]NOL46730.1 hypothetical protein [Synechococcus sp. MIT S9220]QNJ23070.1 putative conserved secreted protein [Synechococcus sp. MIT S9220]